MAASEEGRKHTVKDPFSFSEGTRPTTSSLIAKPRRKPPPDLHRESAAVEDDDGVRSSAEVGASAGAKGKAMAKRVMTNAMTEIEVNKQWLHHREEEGIRSLWCVSPIVSMPPALMAAAFPWNRDGQIRTGSGSDELQEKDHGRDDVTGSPLLTTEGGIVTAMAVHGGPHRAVFHASAPVIGNLRRLKRFRGSDRGGRFEVEGIVFPAREMLQGSSHLPLGMGA